MKRILFIISFFSLGASAQEIPDALRYAQENLNGTARFRAMAGAFGAVGGDLSSLNVNPAGSAIFATNQIGLTLSNYNLSTESKYFGSENIEHDYTLDLNQAGGVLVFNNDDSKSDWKKFTIGLNYENTNNFDNTIFTSGVNPNNSISNYFLSYANQNGGVPLNVLTDSFYEELSFQHAQAYLGYQGFIINPVEDVPGNAAYVSAVPQGSFYHESTSVATGYNGKLTLNLAASYKDRLYFGVNFNSYYTDYWQSSSFLEENDNDPSGASQRIRFNNDLYTYGSGFSFQAGAIGKVTESFRLGLSYDSPTWYRLNDELSQYVSNFVIDPETNVASIDAIVDPNVIIVYDTYRLRTPGKWTGSMAYVFGKLGLLSVDYSIKDYSKMQYAPQNDFGGVNNVMTNTLDMASELRIGAEHRIKQWSLRAGYRWEQSPYRDSETIGDLMSYSGGLGYDFGRARLDLSYAYIHKDINQPMFTQGFTDAPEVHKISNNVSLSLFFAL
ncbi:MAG TPA: outer membrane protein transport protein [Flavobacterium sp.]